MKRKAIHLSILLLTLAIVSSCIEKGYDWNDVNKEGAFSHENGLSVRIGDFDTITLKQQVEVPEPVEIVIEKEIEGLFSEEMYEYFIYDNNGKDEPLGDISFEADFISRITDAADKKFSDFLLEASILNENGDDIGVSIDPQTYRSDIGDPQPFIVNIKKDDIVKLKDAYTMHLTFTFKARMVELEDYLLIENIWLKLSGGISVNL
ncbi:MAG: hypothetical protein LBJ39_04020 [Tannerellaceae bacterium]|jgi:hypothetical protein|nr:hypothetical protein [Tannerellaceae bacterium]